MAIYNNDKDPNEVMWDKIEATRYTYPANVEGSEEFNAVAMSGSHRDFLTSVAMEFDTAISLADINAFFKNASVEDGADLDILMQIWNTSADAYDLDLDELECLVFNVADKNK